MKKILIISFLVLVLGLAGASLKKAQAFSTPAQTSNPKCIGTYYKSASKNNIVDIKTTYYVRVRKASTGSVLNLTNLSNNKINRGDRLYITLSNSANAGGTFYLTTSSTAPATSTGTCSYVPITQPFGIPGF